jgi:hypothetical protein
MIGGHTPRGFLYTPHVSFKQQCCSGQEHHVVACCSKYKYMHERVQMSQICCAPGMSLTLQTREQLGDLLEAMGGFTVGG